MLYLGETPKTDSPEARRALLAAEGYVFLHMGKEALEELKSLHPDVQSECAVLLAQIRILLHMSKWKTAERITRQALEKYPSEEEFTVQRAFALHKLNRGDKAISVIHEAPEWVRRTGILHYNLACYEARLGDLQTARRCLSAACEINAAMRDTAKKDPDLAPLRGTEK